MASGHYQKFSQDHSKANTWRKRGKNDGVIDWRMSAQTIHNLVRGLAKPYVGAHFNIKNKAVKVWKTEIVDCIEKNIEPGKVLEANTLGTVVKAGEDAIRLTETNPKIETDVGSYL